MSLCRWGLVLAFIGSLSACSHAPRTAAPSGVPSALASQSLQISGRISINADSLPGQAGQYFVSQFVLQGSAERGSIQLQSPTGNLLAVLQWQEGQEQQESGASLEQAGHAPILYPDLSSMLQAVLGKHSPTPALLFAWLQGQAMPKQVQPDDWRVDNSQFASKGLIVAERLQPLPRTTVRIKLDPTP